MQAAQTASESVWSDCGDVIVKKRNCLGDDSINDILTVKENMNLFGEELMTFSYEEGKLVDDLAVAERASRCAQSQLSAQRAHYYDKGETKEDK